MIPLEEFKKLDIRIGEITSAERVPETDKLLRLTVSFGAETRQIVAGIAEFFPPESLLGKQAAFAVNLEPKTFKGIESQGMILAAEALGQPVLLHPGSPVPPGSIVK